MFKQDNKAFEAWKGRQGIQIMKLVNKQHVRRKLHPSFDSWNCNTSQLSFIHSFKKAAPKRPFPCLGVLIMLESWGWGSRDRGAGHNVGGGIPELNLITWGTGTWKCCAWFYRWQREKTSCFLVPSTCGLFKMGKCCLKSISSALLLQSDARKVWHYFD